MVHHRHHTSVYRLTLSQHRRVGYREGSNVLKKSCKKKIKKTENKTEKLHSKHHPLNNVYINNSMYQSE
jgi:hypothetical protein